MRELSSLLEPISLTEFFAEYWEKQPLVVKSKDRARYARLLTSQALEELISNSDLRYPAIKLAKDGRFYPPEAFTTDVEVGMCTFRAAADRWKIAELYGSGASITFPALHRSWQPISELCACIEDGIDHSLHANAYLTPGRSSGFPPHYDCHDVLVLQIGGRKRWLIDEPMITLPHDSQVFNPETFTGGARVMEVDLEAGDLLYLPRGLVHSTITAESFSAHVTVGINVYSWVDCVAEVMAGAADVPALRRALPPGFASQALLRAPVVQQLERLLAGTPWQTQAGRLFDQLAQRVRGFKRRSQPPFRAQVSVLSLDSELAAPLHEEYQLALAEERVVLGFERRNYHFPGPMGAALRGICERQRFRLRELTPGLDEQSVLQLARLLHAIGFLRAL